MSVCVLVRSEILWLHENCFKLQRINNKYIDLYIKWVYWLSRGALWCAIPLKKSRILFSHIKFEKIIIMYGKRLLFLFISLIQIIPSMLSALMHWKIKFKNHDCSTGWHNGFSMLPRCQMQAVWGRKYHWWLLSSDSSSQCDNCTSQYLYSSAHWKNTGINMKEMFTFLPATCNLRLKGFYWVFLWLFVLI